MSFLFELPKPGRRESKIGLSRVRATVARLEKKVEAGEAKEQDLERLASLRRRLAREEAQAGDEWEKVFGKST